MWVYLLLHCMDRPCVEVLCGCTSCYTVWTDPCRSTVWMYLLLHCMDRPCVEVLCGYTSCYTVWTDPCRSTVWMYLLLHCMDRPCVEVLCGCAGLCYSPLIHGFAPDVVLPSVLSSDLHCPSPHVFDHFVCMCVGESSPAVQQTVVGKEGGSFT